MKNFLDWPYAAVLIAAIAALVILSLAGKL
jgi:hypothetical protein